MSTVQQDFKRRLARAEITASAVHPADLQAARDRRSLRAITVVCEFIRERFLLMGLDPALDPALAVCLRVGEEAAAKLAAIPDTEALRSADLAITRGGLNDYGEAHSTVVAEIERLAAIYCEGVQPNFVNASLAELLAFCVAMEKLAPAIESEDTAQILPALARA
jgi:hypothetical protein